jgi:hypothetical protein
MVSSKKKPEKKKKEPKKKRVYRRRARPTQTQNQRIVINNQTGGDSTNTRSLAPVISIPTNDNSFLLSTLQSINQGIQGIKGLGIRNNVENIGDIGAGRRLGGHRTQSNSIFSNPYFEGSDNGSISGSISGSINSNKSSNQSPVQQPNQSPVQQPKQKSPVPPPNDQNDSDDSDDDDPGTGSIPVQITGTGNMSVPNTSGMIIENNNGNFNNVTPDINPALFLQQPKQPKKVTDGLPPIPETRPMTVDNYSVDNSSVDNSSDIQSFLMPPPYWTQSILRQSENWNSNNNPYNNQNLSSSENDQDVYNDDQDVYNDDGSLTSDIQESELTKNNSLETNQENRVTNTNSESLTSSQKNYVTNPSGSKRQRISTQRELDEFDEEAANFNLFPTERITYNGEPDENQTQTQTQREDLPTITRADLNRILGENELLKNVNFGRSKFDELSKSVNPSVFLNALDETKDLINNSNLPKKDKEALLIIENSRNLISTGNKKAVSYMYALQNYLKNKRNEENNNEENNRGEDIRRKKSNKNSSSSSSAVYDDDSVASDDMSEFSINLINKNMSTTDLKNNLSKKRTDKEKLEREIEEATDAYKSNNTRQLNDALKQNKVDIIALEKELEKREKELEKRKKSKSKNKKTK